MRLRSLVLAVLLGLGGCGGSSNSDSESADGTVAFEVLVTNAPRSGVRSERRVVVRDAAAWDALWKEHAGDRAELQPKVDFNRRTLLAVFLDESSSCADSVRITQVTRESARLVVRYRAVRFGPNIRCVIDSRPLQIVSIPATTDPVEFFEDAPEGPPPQ